MRTLTLFALIFSVSVISAYTQPRVNYIALQNFNRTPSTYLDQIFLPADDGLTETIFMFRINNNRLTFRRDRSSGNGTTTGEFVAEIELILDLYDKDTPLVPDRTFLKRETWKHTARVTTYEQTQSSDEYVEGFLSIVSEPGTYRLIPTFSINGTNSPFLSTMLTPAFPASRQRTSRRGQQQEELARSMIEIPDFSANTRASIAIVDPASQSTSEFSPLNIGNNVFYAQDYNVLVQVPDGLPADSLILSVTELGPVPEEMQSVVSSVWRTKLGHPLTQAGTLSVGTSNDQTSIMTSEGTSTIYLAEVPNHRFKNSWFRISVTSYVSGDATRIAEKTVLSRWFDIPTSLLNLDVAIDNLKYIVDDSRLREMKRGNQAEKEARFIAFWKERDPTPETEYNELMAEYYKRIDDAFKRFTTPSTPGHESDQGKVFIVYGPPENIERRFPPGGTTQEVWQYPGRTFIFNATSGFGDFQLVTTN